MQAVLQQSLRLSAETVSGWRWTASWTPQANHIQMQQKSSKATGRFILPHTGGFMCPETE